MTKLPRIAITLGDVAGVGPEVVARACRDERVRGGCRPMIVGHPEILRRAAELVDARVTVREINSPGSAEDESGALTCWNPAGDDVLEVAQGTVDARAGDAAYQYLVAAAKAALAGRVDAIVTAPISKAALHAAGHDYPGHTEILAELCGVERYAMMLYLPDGGSGRAAAKPQAAGWPGLERSEAPEAPGSSRSTRSVPATTYDSPLTTHSAPGLAVAHVTLHTSIASVPGLLSTAGIVEKIALTIEFLRRVGCPAPRIGVCALNPHAGEDGLFGDEEARIILPAVETAARQAAEWHDTPCREVHGSESRATVEGETASVVGPIPADTLFRRAIDGEFDGVVAMYHDQGHIALKLVGLGRAVNVTLGLPIVRTSPSHGTAFDIAWQGVARPEGMVDAIRVAAGLAGVVSGEW